MNVDGIIAIEWARAHASVVFILHYLDKFTPEDAEWDAVNQLHKDAVTHLGNIEWVRNAVKGGII